MEEKRSYTRPVQMRMPERLHKRVVRYCETISTAKGQFYSTSRFIREAVEEKLGKVERKRVQRRG